MNVRRLLGLASVGLLLTACITTAPAATQTPGATGPTATLPPGQTPVVPPTEPGATQPPPTEPGATVSPTAPPTAPPPTEPGATAPPPSAPPPPEPPLTVTEAGSHVGENRTVCGRVVSTNFVPTENGLPTFLNVDQAWPFLVFNIVIWGEDRQAFDNPPEVRFLDKDVCVTGLIESYNAWLQIEGVRGTIQVIP